MATDRAAEAAAGDGVAYRAIAATLREAILAGEFPPDRRLPTEAELAADYGVSRQTARQAFGVLVAENLVYRVRGRGSFATPVSPNAGHLQSYGSVEQILALAVDSEMEVVEPLRPRADVVAAGRLQLASDEVMAGVFRRLRHDLAFSVSSIYLPLEVAAAVSPNDFCAPPGTRSRVTMIELVDRSEFGPIAGVRQSINAVPAPAEIAEMIDCLEGEATLRIDRLYVNRQGRLLDLTTSHFKPDRYSYRFELRRTIR